MAAKAKFVFCILCILFEFDELVGQTANQNASTQFGAPTGFEENTDVGVCTCDLTPSECDVNCCCDEQCNAFDRQGFSQCVDAVNRSDWRLCMRTDIIITNNLPQEVVIEQPNLFCVYTDNFKARHYYQIPEIVEANYLYKAYWQHYGGFSYLSPNFPLSISVDKEYQSGDPILMMSDSDIIGYFSLPRGTLSNRCSHGGPIAYLYDEDFECSRGDNKVPTLQELCKVNSTLDVHTYYTGFSVITNPSLYSQSQSTVKQTASNQGSLQSGLKVPSNRLKFVDPSLSVKCYDIKGGEAWCNFTDVTAIPAPSYNQQAGTCDNVVTELRYTIHHQGSGGIFTIDLDYVLRTVSKDNFPLTQKSGVRFYRYDHVHARDLTEEHIFRRSGNPGYVVGKPVMAGKRQTQNGKVSIALSLDSDDWFNLLKSTAIGDCLVAGNSGERLPIEFGVNMRSGCMIRFSLQNMTYACDYAQQVILNVLEGQTFPEYVATFGNTLVENVGDWVPILDDNVPTAAESSGNGACSGMVLGMHIEIIYANIGSLANPQAKIIGIRKIFEDPQTIRFQCTSSSCAPGMEDLSQPFEVATSVSFIDASLPSVMVVAETPSVQAKLPYDFFWPFYYNAASRSKVFVLPTLLVSFLSLLL